MSDALKNPLLEADPLITSESQGHQHYRMTEYEHNFVRLGLLQLRKNVAQKRGHNVSELMTTTNT